MTRFSNHYDGKRGVGASVGHDVAEQARQGQVDSLRLLPRKRNKTETPQFGFIDNARAIAVMMVVAVHVGQRVHQGAPSLHRAFEYGQFGVQLFFLASAYTLCSSANSRTGEVHSWLNFAVRRYFRIAPLYYVGIAMYCGWQFVRQHNGQLNSLDEYTPRNIAMNILLIHGMDPVSNNSVVPGGWSIGTEILFYAVFPICFRAMGGGRPARAALIAALSLLAPVLIGLFSLHTGRRVEDNSFLFFSLPVQLPVFLLGIALCKSNLTGRGPRLRESLLFFLCTTAVIFFTWQCDGLFTFVLLPSLAGLSFVFLVSFLRCLPAEFGKVLVQPIGRLSFSIYIVHFVFCDFASFIGRAAKFDMFLAPLVIFMIYYFVVFSLSLAVSFILRSLIEVPGIRLGRSIVEAMGR